MWDGLRWTSTDMTPVAEFRYRTAGGWKAQPEYGAPNTSGIFNPGTGWSLSGGNQNFHLLGDWLVWHYMHLTRSGGTITVPGNGNMANLLLGTVVDGWRAIYTQSFVSAQSGRLASVTTLADGTFNLTAVTPGNNIVNGDDISWSGLFVRQRGY